MDIESNVLPWKQNDIQHDSTQVLVTQFFIFKIHNITH